MPDYEKSALPKDPELKELLQRSYHDLKVTYVHARCARHCSSKGWTFQALDPNKRLTATSTNGGSSNGSSNNGASSDGGSSSNNNGVSSSSASGNNGGVSFFFRFPARPGLAPPHSRRASRPQQLQAPRAWAAAFWALGLLRELAVHAASRQQQPPVIRPCSCSRLPGEH